MFFEGSEKKVEIVFNKERISPLRSRPESFWSELVAKSQATILGKVSSDEVDAYLLSESSLFVWDDRITMLTCGRTTLVRAIFFLLEAIPKEDWEMLTFQRKNEYFGHFQSTNFLDDIEELGKHFDGSALRFGNMDEHHNFVYHLNRPYTPEPDDITTELLMYHIQGPAAESLRCGSQSIENIREILGLDRFFKDFKIHDFLFEPCGYSMNAVKGDKYATVHITPQEDTSYVSFETNVDIQKEMPEILSSYIDVLKPNSFDLVSFNNDNPLGVDQSYLLLTQVQGNLGCGYQVNFANYFKTHTGVMTPYQL